ncbi:hypothetical protein PLAN_30456 [Planktothrix rubescens CCAP 1459/22]|uniref:Uncharacterized protein n=1 Tax=Planktothrix rubescens CCAP 1459/22 TaxID=329571 RepID=A0A6J7ZM24_PLARU|nr:hypothetical protein PLAN_30456 [Planktothrix rubescens NIVA-CYA 18]
MLEIVNHFQDIELKLLRSHRDNYSICKICKLKFRANNP